MAVIATLDVIVASKVAPFIAGLKKAGDTASNWGKQVTQAITATAEKTASIMSGIFSRSTGLISSMFSSVNGTYGKVISSIFQSMEALVAGVANALMEIGKGIIDIGKHIWEGIKGVFGGITKVFSSIFTGVSTLIGAIGGPIGLIVSGAITTMLSGIVSGISDAIGAVLKTVFKVAGSVLSTIANTVGILGKAIVEAIMPIAGAIGAVISSLYSMGKAAQETIIDTYKMGHKLDITTQQTTAMAVAAKKAGYDFDTMGHVLLKMSANLYEAQIHGGEVANIMNILKVNLRDLNKLNAYQQFELLSESLNKLGNQGQKLGFAEKIFGRGGLEILPWIEVGKQGLDEIMKKNEELGYSVDVVTARQILNVKKLQQEIGRAWEGIGNTIAGVMAPIEQQVLTWWNDIVRQISSILKTYTKEITQFLQLVWDAIKWSIDKFLEWAGTLEVGFKGIFQFLGFNTEAWKTWQDGVKDVLAHILYFFSNLYDNISTYLDNLMNKIIKFAVSMADAYDKIFGPKDYTFLEQMKPEFGYPLRKALTELGFDWAGGDKKPGVSFDDWQKRNGSIFGNGSGGILGDISNLINNSRNMFSNLGTIIYQEVIKGMYKGGSINTTPVPIASPAIKWGTAEAGAEVAKFHNWSQNELDKNKIPEAQLANLQKISVILTDILKRFREGVFLSPSKM